MSLEQFVAIVSVAVATIFGIMNYSRNTRNDRASSSNRSQADIVTLLNQSMEILTRQLEEIKSDVRDIKKDLRESEIKVSAQDEKIKSLFTMYHGLKEEVTELGREIREIRE